MYGTFRMNGDVHDQNEKTNSYDNGYGCGLKVEMQSFMMEITVSGGAQSSHLFLQLVNGSNIVSFCHVLILWLRQAIPVCLSIG